MATCARPFLGPLRLTAPRVYWTLYAQADLPAPSSLVQVRPAQTRFKVKAGVTMPARFGYQYPGLSHVNARVGPYSKGHRGGVRPPGLPNLRRWTHWSATQHLICAGHPLNAIPPFCKSIIKCGELTNTFKIHRFFILGSYAGASNTDLGTAGDPRKGLPGLLLASALSFYAVQSTQRVQKAYWSRPPRRG